MPTTTTNLGLTLPTPNVDTGWGSTLNTDFTLIDNLFTAAGTGTSVGVNVGSGKTLTMAGTLILGGGDGTGTVTAPTIRGAARTGTNGLGANLIIDAANGTGSGGSGGIYFRTAPAGTSGTTANTMQYSLSIINSGNVGIGLTVPSTKLHVSGTDPELRVQSTSSTNGMIRFLNTSGSMSIGMSGAATNTLLTYDRINNQTVHEYLGGASGYHAFYTANTERMRINSSGNVLATSTGLGYGTGAGGTVTQLTSKGTDVTLNKPSGRIITSNSSLTPGQSGIFIFYNSTISPADTLILNLLHPANAGYNINVYDVKAVTTENGGAAYITVKNLSTTTTYSDALLLNFAIIKGATS